MANLFTRHEINILTSDCRLTLERMKTRSLSIPAADLLESYFFLDCLDEVAPLMKAPTTASAASLFSKRYSFMLLASSLYAMTMFNKAFDYSIENCYIESSMNGESWLPKLRLKNWQATQPEEGRRREWRDQVIHQIFTGNLAKLWRNISRASSVSKAVLWENTAIYVYWLYEKKMREGATLQQKMRIEEDFHYLLKAAPTYLFGECKNPLGRFDQPKERSTSSSEPIRVRKTCCFYYQTCGEKEYCATCPKKKLEAKTLVRS